MARTYTELEAWGIFIGGLIIGVVLTSLFWAFITIPEKDSKTGKEAENASKSNFSNAIVENPTEFIMHCEKINGEVNWDSSGMRQCVIFGNPDEHIASMNKLCEEFNLTLSYGSYGVKCEGKI